MCALMSMHIFTGEAALQALGSRSPANRPGIYLHSIGRQACSDFIWPKARRVLCTHAQVDSLYIATAHFTPHHMDSIAAFQGLKVLHMDWKTMVGAVDSAAFSVFGELTQLEELVLAPQLTGVDDEGFMLGFGPLHRLRRLELCGVERVRILGKCFCMCLST